MAYRCGGYQRAGTAVCRSYYVPTETFEAAVLRAVAESLALRMGGSDVRRQISNVAARLHKDAALRLRYLGQEADLRDKQRAFQMILDKLDSIEEQVEALLTSADELFTTWAVLDPAERRQRLREVVSVIVVNKIASGGDSDSATIHFRGLLRSSETVRKLVREEIGTTAYLRQQNGLQADPDLEADVNNLAGSPGQS